MRNIINKARDQKTWKDFFKAMFCGAGWVPGGPRMGPPHPDEPTPMRKHYDPSIPRVMEMYILGHFLISVVIQQSLTHNVELLMADEYRPFCLPHRKSRQYWRNLRRLA